MYVVRRVCSCLAGKHHNAVSRFPICSRLCVASRCSGHWLHWGHHHPPSHVRCDCSSHRHCCGVCLSAAPAVFAPIAVLTVVSSGGGCWSDLACFCPTTCSCGVKAAMTPCVLLLFAKEAMASSILFNAFFALAPCIKRAQCGCDEGFVDQ